MTPPEPEATRLLERLANGDGAAAHLLLPLVYRELRGLAVRALRRDAASSLQPTALVHEAYLRMFDGTQPRLDDQRHFLGVAARAMRSVVVDHFRARATSKRGGGATPRLLEPGEIPVDDRAEEVLGLHEALERLAEVDPQLARIVELRFFGGLTQEEVADVLGVSTRTVERGWRSARAWLKAELRAGESPP